MRAGDDGVIRILNPSINLNSCRAALSIADGSDIVYVAVGVHPNDALSWNEDTVAQLKHMAEHPRVVAIGEIGLDYYRDRAPRELQARIFVEQLSLAAELGLPVVIHNRQATKDVMRILSDWQHDLERKGSSLASRPGVLHSFSSDEEAAQLAIAKNFFIGITGPVTFRNADELRNIVSSLPLDRLLIETDAPFLTPHPYRGKRNQPAYVKYVAEKIAEVRGESFNEVASNTTTNANALFNW
jgi:TatD DNase family protein